MLVWSQDFDVDVAVVREREGCFILFWSWSYLRCRLALSHRHRVEVCTISFESMISVWLNLCKHIKRKPVKKVCLHPCSSLSHPHHQVVICANWFNRHIWVWFKSSKLNKNPYTVAWFPFMVRSVRSLDDVTKRLYDRQFHAKPGVCVCVCVV